MRGAVVYSYANARARAIRSKRLSPEDWHFLKSSPGLERLLQYLSTTHYAPFIMSPEASSSTAAEVAPSIRSYANIAHRVPGLLPEKKVVERELYRSLTEDYAKIVRSLRGERQRAVILALYSRFEGENLKILMRALFSGRSRQEVEHLLYPLGRLSRIPWDALWKLQKMSDVRDSLGRTIFGPALRFAFPQFEAQGRLFPLEMAVDHACFKEIVRARETLPRQDRPAARSVIGPFIDLVNISWIIRLRERYGLQPEQIVNYTVPGGQLITLKIIAKLAQAADVASFISRLPVSAARRMEGVVKWEQVVERFRMIFLDSVRRAFTGPPFTIAVELACLLEEEIEIERLVSLIESAAATSAKGQVSGDSSQAMSHMQGEEDSAGMGTDGLAQSVEWSDVQTG